MLAIQLAVERINILAQFTPEKKRFAVMKMKMPIGTVAPVSAVA
jgi:hypothetical protein